MSPKPFLVTIVYAKCTRRERERLELWENLEVLSEVDMPWLVGGDFNIVAMASER